MSAARPLRALVTGGGGFLGGVLSRRLLDEGYAVVSYSRGDYPALRAAGVETVRGDLGDAAALERATAGADVVFHVAAQAGVWGPRAEFERANVHGTRHVLEACLKNRVPRLVYTSSPSVCFDGKDHKRAGADLPYATRWLASYPETKATAERLVLAANGRGGLASVALRPHLIFGPGDPHLVPRLLEKARAGRLLVVGPGTNEVSLTYVENAAWAHVCAARALEAGAAATCAGRAYFVCQREPVQLWAWVKGLLEALGERPPARRVPRRVAYAAGALCELAWNALPLRGEPPMTRFVALQLAGDHSYDLAPLERDLGYVERVGLEEASARLIESLRTASPSGAPR